MNPKVVLAKEVSELFSLWAKTITGVNTQEEKAATVAPSLQIYDTDSRSPEHTFCRIFCAQTRGASFCLQFLRRFFALAQFPVTKKNGFEGSNLANNLALCPIREGTRFSYLVRATFHNFPLDRRLHSLSWTRSLPLARGRHCHRRCLALQGRTTRLHRVFMHGRQRKQRPECPSR